ncbi:methyl-accepting chemotaxis protein [Ectothiorhodospira sp. BSL-9]|uniref:methyl-accepting chemotaxis protein n=1 Tax=Ectothiorhodospira sp. BSL-9 TaxID=1442136 RepID=UPI0007B4FB06|nr:methyl-accepting chemotaxis protein [Ectothiorhodospira sp. BSL-9]
MSIKAKISAGFATVALITLALGGLGYWGAVKSESAIGELGSLRLPSVQTVLEMQVALSDLVGSFRTLMDQTATQEQRTVQYQAIEEARNVYGQAVDRYDALPKTAEEAAAWEAFQTTLPNWLEANNTILALHHELDEMRRATPQGDFTAQWQQIATQTMGETLRHQEAAFQALDQLVQLNMRAAAVEVEEGLSQARWLEGISLAAMIIGVLLAALLGILITRGITGPLRLLVDSVERVRDTGNFNERITYHRRDEIGAVITSFNALLESQRQALEEVNMAVHALASGDFGSRIKGDYAGDLDSLKTGFNASADTIQLTMNELAKVMQALRTGEFSVSIDPNRVEGEFRRMLENASTGMHSLDDSTKGIISVMEHMAGGVFRHRIEADAAGQMLKLKHMANDSVSALEEAIHEIQTVMIAQARGDLSLRVEGQYAGDLAVLATSANDTAEKLSDIILKINDAVLCVSTGAGQISTGNTNLSQRTEEQAASLEETATSLEEITSTVRQNADNARQASQQADQAKTMAESGGHKVRQAMENMRELTASSEKMTNIISVIDGIAFQTNILALNAAVEAARAGEQGRGFAVVASEVRTLAQRSSAAAKEIQSLIREDVSIVEDGTRAVHETSASMEEIIRAIKRMSDINGEIAAASDEQTQGIEQINQAVSQMDDVTQQNAALVEEAAAAAESLVDQAEQLSAAVSAFQLREAQPDRQQLLMHDKEVELIPKRWE